MSNNIIEHFVSLTKIPHCSKSTDKLLEFLERFAIYRDYLVEIDEFNNILVKPKDMESKLVLQAHYDMVCMGNAPKIETYVEDGWMYAKESSLGADNGMAIAMMMELMDRGEKLEFLFTSDEEIGLVGASSITLNLTSSYMLNLDFEDEGIVCIGCAGGADLIANKMFEKSHPYPYFYEISIADLSGGHSGVDIDKGIPSAIKLLSEYLSDKSVKIASCFGGERRNSIPANIVMRLSSLNLLKSEGLVTVSKLNEDIEVYSSDNFLNLLVDFKQGIHSYNKEFNLPDTSINLAIVNFENGMAKIECSSRAMSEEGLESINQESLTLFQKYGFETTIEDKYPSWRPEVNEFTSLVNSEMKSVYGESRYEAIHAGLECGVLLENYPNIKFASIGPTIVYPHSTRERVNLDSVEKIFRVVENIISKL